MKSLNGCLQCQESVVVQRLVVNDLEDIYVPKQVRAQDGD